MVQVDSQLVTVASNLSSRPIVILGAARSGTKFLRNTLAASESVAATPYDLNYVWRSGNESHPDDALPPSLCGDKTRSRIRAELRKAAGMGGMDDGKRLLEKTVSNTLRLPFVARVLPNADFVHIIRDGREVVASSIAQWQSGTDWRYLLRKARSFPLSNYKYALWYLGNRMRTGSRSRETAIWGVRYPGIEVDASSLPIAAVCARQWVASVSSVQEARAVDDTLRYREIRYEDLIASDSALIELVRWLELPDETRILEQYRRTLRTRIGRSWDQAVSDESKVAVLREIEPMLRTLDYM